MYLTLARSVTIPVDLLTLSYISSKIQGWKLLFATSSTTNGNLLNSSTSATSVVKSGSISSPLSLNKEIIFGEWAEIFFKSPRVYTVYHMYKNSVNIRKYANQGLKKPFALSKTSANVAHVPTQSYIYRLLATCVQTNAFIKHKMTNVLGLNHPVVRISRCGRGNLSSILSWGILYA